MGASAPKSETVVKGGKPVIVREYLSPEYLKELSSLAAFYGQRAQQAASTRQATLNRYLSSYGEGPAYDPYTTSTGEVIKPYQAPAIYDTTKLVEAAEAGGMFRPPAEGKKKESREAYSDALKVNQGTGTNPNSVFQRMTNS
jgi:hypothetical protein